MCTVKTERDIILPGTHTPIPKNRRCVSKRRCPVGASSHEIGKRRKLCSPNRNAIPWPGGKKLLNKRTPSSWEEAGTAPVFFNTFTDACYNHSTGNRIPIATPGPERASRMCGNAARPNRTQEAMPDYGLTLSRIRLMGACPDRYASSGQR